jgi:hypothetical protein
MEVFEGGAEMMFGCFANLRVNYSKLGGIM